MDKNKKPDYDYEAIMAAWENVLNDTIFFQQKTLY